MFCLEARKMQSESNCDRMRIRNENIWSWKDIKQRRARVYYAAENLASENWESSEQIDILIAKLRHANETDRTEWELKMGIRTGNIIPGFLQQLRRFLSSHRPSFRKNSYC
ncbi:uncharacterized protein PHALS_14756 [Plasmopara halstedii]|uniref:Uncharacterized protein n=1 Tax=Plasmopara halstedii TaxID=4781 RepID=A0A0P1AQT5_PLAHL|nr:uncharacterized protein PHALS_14756 [Plasmopara halstedii]CEG43920.1 hypothetical protein PHALS_14756 [Plasmopara halstedii]|eukprot:XP_024580289.1 hypothetical protein PHALS_14756 [Plasmopara halstedii]